MVWPANASRHLPSVALLEFAVFVCSHFGSTAPSPLQMAMRLPAPHKPYPQGMQNSPQLCLQPHSGVHSVMQPHRVAPAAPALAPALAVPPTPPARPACSPCSMGASTCHQRQRAEQREGIQGDTAAVRARHATLSVCKCTSCRQCACAHSTPGRTSAALWCASGSTSGLVSGRLKAAHKHTLPDEHSRQTTKGSCQISVSAERGAAHQFVCSADLHSQTQTEKHTGTHKN